MGPGGQNTSLSQKILSVAPSLGSIVERRLLTFIVASTAFFMFYLSLRMMFAPPQPPPAANVAEADGQAAAEMLVDADQAASVTPSLESADGTEDPESAQEPAPDRPPQPEWLTLGSMHPDSGYYMLITLNSQGGGVERIELTERDDEGQFRYRRVDVRHGYLGYFAGEPAEKAVGVLVNVVGPGTPGEEAGILVGDVIVSVSGQPVATRDDIETALLSSRAGDSVVLEILRGESVTPQQLNATLSEHPLDLVRLARDGGDDQIEGNLTRLSCLLTLSQVNRKSIEPSKRSIAGMVNPMELNWLVTRPGAESGESAQFSVELSGSEMQAVGGQPIRITRTYGLVPNSYHVDMTVQLDNLADEPQDLAYRLEGANGITLEGWWYSNKISPNMKGGAAARDVVYKTDASGHQLLSGFTLLNRAKKETTNPNETIFAGDSAKTNVS